jgi:hypothetical protein
MADSTLDPEALTGGPDRNVRRGHGTRALGPSDTSDSGSDLLGAPGLAQQDELLPGTGTTSDPEASTANYTAGPDVGDADLDSDTDSTGTGERKTAGRDTVARDGSDIDVDRVESFHRRGGSEDLGSPDLDEGADDEAAEPEDGSNDEGFGPDPTDQPERL